MEMKNSKLKWTLGILGTIILGAIGSGLWSLLFEPVSLWTGRVLFTIATLGLDSLRTNVYAEVAKGLHEESSLVILTLIVFITFLALGYYRGILYGERHGDRKIKRIISQIKTDIPDEDDLTQSIKQALEARMNVLSGQLSKLITLILICAIVFCSFQLFTTSYTNAAVTHFRQCYTICEPFISDQQAKDFRSRFALVRSRTDYVTLLQDFYKIAAANGRKCPEFTAF
jgi:hypothetical protein